MRADGVVVDSIVCELLLVVEMLVGDARIVMKLMDMHSCCGAISRFNRFVVGSICITVAKWLHDGGSPTSAWCMIYSHFVGK